MASSHSFHTPPVPLLPLLSLLEPYSCPPHPFTSPLLPSFAGARHAPGWATPTSPPSPLPSPPPGVPSDDSWLGHSKIDPAKGKAHPMGPEQRRGRRDLQVWRV